MANLNVPFLPDADRLGLCPVCGGAPLPTWLAPARVRKSKSAPTFRTGAVEAAYREVFLNAKAQIMRFLFAHPGSLLWKIRAYHPVGNRWGWWRSGTAARLKRLTI